MSIRRIGLLILVGLMVSLPLLRAEEPEAKSFDDFYLEGLRLKLKGEHLEALAAFESALELEPNSSSALYELAHYYLALQQTGMAYESLRKAVEHAPENSYYKSALANLSRQLRYYDEAIELYRELTEAYPERLENHFYLSEIYLGRNEVHKAIESLDKLENNMGLNEMVSMHKYELYKAIGEEDNARKEIEKLSAKFPSEPRYITLVGDSYLDQGNLEKALEYYKKSQALDPANPYYFLSMANYYTLTGDEEGVYREIENALRSPELSLDAKLDVLGKYDEHILAQGEDGSKSTLLAKALTEQYPQEKRMNMLYGGLLLQDNKPEEARFQFQLVTEGEPENREAWNELLGIAVRENNMGDVISICHNALLHFPADADFYHFLGMAYYIEENNEEALKALLEGIANMPASDRKTLSTLYGQIGDIYHELNDKAKCYEAYEKALEYNENNLLVLNNYAYFLALDGENLDRAERMSSKTVQAEPNNPTYLDTYAWVFYRKGNYSLAKFYIESAVKQPEADESEEIMEHYREILSKYEEHK